MTTPPAVSEANNKRTHNFVLNFMSGPPLNKSLVYSILYCKWCAFPEGSNSLLEDCRDARIALVFLTVKATFGKPPASRSVWLKIPVEKTRNKNSGHLLPSAHLRRRN